MSNVIILQHPDRLPFAFSNFRWNIFWEISENILPLLRTSKHTMIIIRIKVTAFSGLSFNSTLEKSWINFIIIVGTELWKLQSFSSDMNLRTIPSTGTGITNISLTPRKVLFSASKIQETNLCHILLPTIRYTEVFFDQPQLTGVLVLHAQRYLFSQKR